MIKESHVKESKLTLHHTCLSRIAGFIVSKKDKDLIKTIKIIQWAKSHLSPTSPADDSFFPQRRELLGGRSHNLGPYSNTKNR